MPGRRKSKDAIGLKLGLKGQRVVLLSENCPKWVLSDLALCWQVGLPAYITNTTENNLYLVAVVGPPWPSYQPAPQQQNWWLPEHHNLTNLT